MLFCVRLPDLILLLQGNSVIMYRDAELRKFQYYVHATWMGGLYASPSIAGSR